MPLDSLPNGIQLFVYRTVNGFVLLGVPNFQPPTIHSYFRLRITSFYGISIFIRNSSTYRRVRDWMSVFFTHHSLNLHLFYHPCAKHTHPFLLSSGPSQSWLIFLQSAFHLDSDFVTLWWCWTYFTKWLPLTLGALGGERIQSFQTKTM